MFKELFQKSHRKLTEFKTKKGETPKSPEPVFPPNIQEAEPSEQSTDRPPRENPRTSRTHRRSKQGDTEGAWDISQFEIPVDKSKVRFHDLDLPPEIMHAIADQGFEYCTPIQAELLPKALLGSDTSGKAQTGTGKTAAFLIDIYTRLLRNPIPGKRVHGAPRVLILAPTRELVLQIEADARDMGKYTDIQTLAVLGGVGYDQQKRALRERPVDIMMATPGRLLDFQRQRLIDLHKVEILVIDEADRMLDMGFIPDVRKIVHSTPAKDKRQTLFFSATLTPEVERLAKQWTRDPVHVEIEPSQVEAESINQMIYIVTAEDKFWVLLNLITGQKLQRVLVFTNRKDQTNRLADRLKQYDISCSVLSGDIPQKKRITTLEAFRNGRIRVLVATDVAARGLHIEDISHVVNFTLPRDPEDYVHRIGRTGRAGADGISVSFACEDDSFYIPPIEKYLGHSLKCVNPDEALLQKRTPKHKPSRAKNVSNFQKRNRPSMKKSGPQKSRSARGRQAGKGAG